MDLQTPTDNQTGRQNAPKENASSTNFSPIQWSKWLYEIRQQFGRGTSRAEAYEDCRKHHEALIVEELKHSG